MSDNERKQDGYQPLREGYQPKEEHGYQPGNNQGQQIITPPQGGTGEVTPKSGRNNQNDK